MFFLKRRPRRKVWRLYRLAGKEIVLPDGKKIYVRQVLGVSDGKIIVRDDEGKIRILKL